MKSSHGSPPGPGVRQVGLVVACLVTSCWVATGTVRSGEPGKPLASGLPNLPLRRPATRLARTFHHFRPELEAQGWVELGDGTIARDKDRAGLLADRRDRPRPRKITQSAQVTPPDASVTGISKNPRLVLGGVSYKMRNPKPPPIVGLKAQNTVAEVLARTILQSVDVGCADVEPVYLPAGSDDWRLVLITRLFTPANVGEKFWIVNKIDHARNDVLTRLRPDEYVTMRLVDVLIGNPDRHAGNWIITESGHVLAMDHDLSMITRSLLLDPKIDWYANFTPEISLEKDTAPVEYVDSAVAAGVHPVCGGIDRILRRGEDCPVLAGIVKKQPDLPVQMARKIVARLGDQALRRLIDDVPVVLCGRERRRELLDLMTARRDQLVAVTERYFAARRGGSATAR